MFAATPPPPYVAVIFISRRTAVDDDGYGRAAERLEELARSQPGYLGIESARDPGSGFGITVSYWSDEAAARAWGRHAEHLAVQRLGRERWYEAYEVRLARVAHARGRDAGDR